MQEGLSAPVCHWFCSSLPIRTLRQARQALLLRRMSSWWRWRQTVNTTRKIMSQYPRSSTSRSYKDAVAALNSLQSNSEYIKRAKLKPIDKREDRFLYAKQCAEMIGLGSKELSNLSVIHVAGTKGKGSTSALCESILRHNGYHTGFFLSPHLVSVRERITIDGQPLSAQIFSNYFWFVFNKLQEKKNPDIMMPPYFAFLTLMAFHVFLEEQVDVAIIEVGIGGEYDTTNILEYPSVVGITSLGIDHTSLLGSTLSSIAWHKAGILKPSAVGFTVQGHSPEALKVLEERSVERKCPVEIVPSLDKYTWPELKSRQNALSLQPTQQLNASLALQLSNAWMIRNSLSTSDNEAVSPTLAIKEASPFIISSKTADGLFKCQWPGRTQILKSVCGRFTYFLDGAHTIESMVACVKWYLQSRPTRSTVRHALLLNMTGDRDRRQVIEPLLHCNFDKIIFSSNIVYSSTSQNDLVNLQLSQNNQLNQTRNLHDLWTSMTCYENEQKGNVNAVSSTKTSFTSSVNEALSELNNENDEWSVLVTGSLHLVGAVLSVIDPNLKKSLAEKYPI